MDAFGVCEAQTGVSETFSLLLLTEKKNRAAQQVGVYLLLGTNQN